MPTPAQARRGLIPLAARPAISAALGAHSRGYAARHQGSGLVLTNQAAHLSARFAPGGTRVSVSAGSSSGGTLGLRPARVGLGTRLRPVGSATLSSDANRVEYRFRGLEEWFSNGPMGLEQGFTVPRPAAGASRTLTLTMALSGRLRPRLEPDRTAVSFATAHGHRALAYGDLVSYDRTGTRLHSWLTVGDRSLQIHVDTAGAVFPLRVDPLIQQAKVTPTGAVVGDQVGNAIAISSDGSTIVVGDRALNSYAGAVYVLTKPAGGWGSGTPGQAKLTASDAATQANLGANVTISGDGSVVASGAENAIGHTGAAYLFVRPASGWADATQTVELTGPSANAYFGHATAISTDGTELAVGAFGINSSAGEVDVFDKPAAGWGTTTPNESVLTASDAAANGYLGYSVAFSADGSTLAAGAYYAGVGGHAYVFTRPAAGWTSATQSAELNPSDPTSGMEFGLTLAVSQDGSTVAVGAPTATESGVTLRGAAYVFTKPAAGWAGAAVTQTAKLTASDGASVDQLSESLAIAPDGSAVYAGAPYHAVGGVTDAGSVDEFDRPAAGWTDATAESSALVASDPYGGAIFGSSVAMSSDGSALAVGSTAASGGIGAAYVFSNHCISCTWTGGSSWSTAADWSTGSTPASGADLTFPASACPSYCAVSNDISGLAVHSLTVDDRTPYTFSGNGISLGAGGLSTTSLGTSGGVAWNIPIALSAPQTWSVSTGNYSGQLQLGGAITGPSADPLTLNLSSNAIVVTSADNELGPLTAGGSGFLMMAGGSINGTDGQPLSFNSGSILLLESGASTGPVTFNSGSEVAIGSSATPLMQVNGTATLNSGSTALIYMNTGNGSPVAGTDYAQLRASGDITLHSGLILATTFAAASCAIPAGTTFTLVQTTGGTLSGTFNGLPDGAKVTPQCYGSGTAPQLVLHYTSTAATATVVTGTTTTLIANPTTAATNQSVTLTASVAPASGAITPSGTVAFAQGGTPISGCGSQTLDATGTATCTTTFVAASSPLSLTAAYTPDASTSFTPSSTASPLSFTTTTGWTSIALTSDAAWTLITGDTVTYTATVSPADAGAASPTGAVQFDDGATPITGCETQTLDATGTATCTTSFATAGTHDVWAKYAGDANFAAAGPSATVPTAVRGPAASVAVSTGASSITADGSSTTTVTATVSDASHNGVAGDTVAFTSSDAGQSIGAVTDHGDGTYTATITSSTTPGPSTITATDSSVTPAVTGTATVTQNAVAPSNATAPAINGQAQSGQTLTADHGSWQGSAPLSYSYQWQRCSGGTCTDITSATGTTYTSTDSDVGETLRVTVTASNSTLTGGTTATASSPQTATVAAAPAPPAPPTPTPPAPPTPTPPTPSTPSTPTIGQAPATISGTSTATFTFTGDAGAGFVCSLDGAAATQCSSPAQYTGLGDGAHTFAVSAVEQGVSSAAQSYGWTVDTQPPAPPTIIGGPDPETGSSTATLQFEADPDATTSCSIDGRAYALCTSPVTLHKLGLGQHTFSVTQTDAAGITSAAATRTWLYDMHFTNGNAGSNAKAVKLLVNPDLAVDKSGSVGVGCQLNRGSLESCDVTATYDPNATGAAADRHARRASAHAAGAAVIGSGRIHLDAIGKESGVVSMTLNDRGRALLKDHPGGLHVTLAITASTFDGAQQFTRTKTTMLHPPQLLVIPNIGLFPGGGTTLDGAGRAYVRAVVGVLQDATKVECEGYTDNTVSGRQAHDLGLNRAQAVCDALAADGLSAPTSAISFGASRPLASNATAAGRARNRRVEIRVWF